VALLAAGILFTPRWLAQARYRRNMARRAVAARAPTPA
jgi:hypothetical protein